MTRPPILVKHDQRGCTAWRLSTDSRAQSLGIKNHPPSLPSCDSGHTAYTSLGLETQVRSVGREDPQEKGMAAHSSILPWRIPWTEEPGGLMSTGSQRVGNVWVTMHSIYLRWDWAKHFIWLSLISKMRIITPYKTMVNIKQDHANKLLILVQKTLNLGYNF